MEENAYFRTAERIKASSPRRGSKTARRLGFPTSQCGETLRPQGQKKLGYIPFPADEAKPHAAQASPPRRTATPLPKAAMIAPPSPNSPPCNIPVIPPRHRPVTNPPIPHQSPPILHQTLMPPSAHSAKRNHPAVKINYICNRPAIVSA